MNKTLIFLIISTSILVLSVVVICISPIINNIEVSATYSVGQRIWSPAKWRTLNCAIFADKEKSDTIQLDDIQKYKKYKNICYRQKAMYGLENATFVINIILAFLCADLTLLHFLNVGKNFEKKTGLIGILSGIIGFILTLVYVCFSGYIFTNDVAYGIIDPENFNFYEPINLLKLFPNGALYKWEAGKYVTVNENDKEENAQYLLYKDLGTKQYNYISDYYETYYKNEPKSTSLPKANLNKCNINKNYAKSGNQEDSCDYLYYTPENKVENQYIYDRWLTSLILSIFIVACYIFQAIFGFLLFKSNEEISPSSEETPIIYKK